MMKIWLAAGLVGAFTLTAPVFAETKVPGDPHADDPVGIVADPCPVHPKPSDEAGWTMWNLHMLTRDFGQHGRYAADNRALAGQKVRVVFMGDSITDNWINEDPSMFTDGLVDRGISGQTTAQMLVRFRDDVIALRPQAVHIMAMTNDIAGNTGAATMETVLGHVQSMADLARAHGIKVIKVAHKRDAVHHPSNFPSAIGVSPHNRHPPGPSQEFTGDFSADSTTSAGNDCGSVHGTLSLVSPAYGLGIT